MSAPANKQLITGDTLKLIAPIAFAVLYGTLAARSEIIVSTYIICAALAVVGLCVFRFGRSRATRNAFGYIAYCAIVIGAVVAMASGIYQQGS